MIDFFMYSLWNVPGREVGRICFLIPRIPPGEKEEKY